MRLLIDGYNVLHARGLMGQRFGPDAFRKVRTRFLNELAEALGAVEAHLTTVVFDAASPPANLPGRTSHKGITVLFAVGDDDADERIEQLIAEHSSPKTLTVVSSDHRIRQAASRRKARVLSADEFLADLESRRRHAATDDAPPKAEPRDRGLSADESAFWLEEFRELDEQPETLEAFGQEPGGQLTDAEIREIEREIEREFGPSD